MQPHEAMTLAWSVKSVGNQGLKLIGQQVSSRLALYYQLDKVRGPTTKKKDLSSDKSA